MNQPFVSIIIACKNNAGAAVACLDSVCAQTYKNIEIIVVDNFSTDGTYDIVKRYTNHVFKLGPERSTQFNYGFKQSTGDYIYRIGLEFVLEPDLVEKCVAKMQSGYDALALHNQSIGDSIWAKVRYYERESYKGDQSIVAVRFMKREVFEAVGMFDETLVAGEDFDLHNRIVDAGYKWSHVDAIEKHIGEPKNIGDVWKKFYYYGRTIGRYQKKSGARGKQQLVFFRPSFKKLQKDLIKHPHLFLAFWFYMAVKYAAGAAGVMRGAPASLAKRNLKTILLISFGPSQSMSNGYFIRTQQIKKIYQDTNDSVIHLEFVTKNKFDTRQLPADTGVEWLMLSTIPLFIHRPMLNLFGFDPVQILVSQIEMNMKILFRWRSFKTVSHTIVEGALLPLPVLMGRILSRKISLDTHAINTQIALQIYKKHKFKGAIRAILWYPIEFMLFHISSRIIAISKPDKLLVQELFRISGDKIDVIDHQSIIKNGDYIDSGVKKRTELGLQDKTILLFVGDLGAVQNIEAVDFLFKNFVPKLSSNPSVALIIVGNNPNKLAGILDQVEFTGFVDKLEPYIAMADFCLAPLSTGGGVKTKVLDYLAMNKQIIATPIAMEGINLGIDKKKLVKEFDIGNFVGGTFEVIRRN